MKIDLYHGLSVTAKDANEFIDLDTVLKGCTMMSEAADLIKDIVEKIKKLKETCNADTLSVEGQTMEDKIELFENDTNQFYLYISNLVSSIQSTTLREFNKKQTILNEEAKKIDMQTNNNTSNGIEE